MRRILYAKYKTADLNKVMTKHCQHPSTQEWERLLALLWKFTSSRTVIFEVLNIAKKSRTKSWCVHLLDVLGGRISTNKCSSSRSIRGSIVHPTILVGLLYLISRNWSSPHGKYIIHPVIFKLHLVYTTEVQRSVWRYDGYAKYHSSIFGFKGWFKASMITNLTSTKGT